MKRVKDLIKLSLSLKNLLLNKNLNKASLQLQKQRTQNSWITGLSKFKNNDNPIVFYTEYKKDYYLPLSNNILSNISGLASLPDALRIQFKNDPTYFKKFAIFILTENAKILYYLFSIPYSNENFIKNIFKSFSLIYTKDMLKMDKELSDLHKTRHLNTCQHLLNIICHKFYTDIIILNKIFVTNIDFTHYRRIPISLLIEYFIFNENTKNIISKDSINLKFIDHENHILSEAIDLFKKEESMQQISQMHADLLLYQLIAASDGIVQIVKFYRDVKADYKGTAKGHFTLIPHLFTDRKTAQAYMNNYTTFLTQKINLLSDSVIKKSLIKDYNYLIKIKHRCSKPNSDIKDLVLEFNEILLKKSLDVNYKDLSINFTIATDINVDYTFITDILPIIKQNVENNYFIFDIDVIFPKDNKINVYKFNQAMSTIIDKILPQELRENLHNNFNKYIENGTK